MMMASWALILARGAALRAWIKRRWDDAFLLPKEKISRDALAMRAACSDPLGCQRLMEAFDAHASGLPSTNPRLLDLISDDDIEGSVEGMAMFYALFLSGEDQSRVEAFCSAMEMPCLSARAAQARGEALCHALRDLRVCAAHFSVHGSLSGPPLGHGRDAIFALKDCPADLWPIFSRVCLEIVPAWLSCWGRAWESCLEKERPALAHAVSSTFYSIEKDLYEQGPSYLPAMLQALPIPMLATLSHAARWDRPKCSLSAAGPMIAALLERSALGKNVEDKTCPGVGRSQRRQRL